MHSTRSHSGISNRYSAKHTSVPVNFICFAPQAKHVSIVGDFNAWDPALNPMKRQPDGAWLVQLMLCHGHHHYMFCVDEKLVLDPRAQGIGRNQNNERVSMVAVS